MGEKKIARVDCMKSVFGKMLWKHQQQIKYAPGF